MVNHLSDSVSIVELDRRRRARVDAHAARRRRAARHRLRRPGRRPAPSSPRRTAARTAPAIRQLDDRRASAAPTSGCSTPTTSAPPLGGTPLAILTLFGDTPRALAVSPDGITVYAAVFHSGNQTTTMNDRARRRRGGAVTAARAMPAACPRPNANAGAPQPEVGLIVKFNGTPLGRRARPRLGQRRCRSSLPDQDVFVIDANANPPAPVAGPPASPASAPSCSTWRSTREREGLRLQHRRAQRGALRGPGIARAGTRCAATCTRAASRCSTARTSLPRHLNKHIDYAVRRRRPNEKAQSLALPMDMAVSGDGQTLYVAAFGSRRSASSTRRSSRPTRSCRRRESDRGDGGGPSGLVLDEARDRLYVMNRFDNAISIDRHRRPRARRSRTCRCIQPRAGERAGRPPFLYDARATSSTRRRVVRELPRLRRLRQPGVGPRRPGRRRVNQPEPDQRSGVGDHGLPSAEGTDDDAEPARHGERTARCTGAATAPAATSRAATRSTRTPRSRSSIRRSSACSAAPAELTRRRDAGVHRLHPAVTIRRTRSARSTTRYRRAAGRPDFFLERAHRRTSTATAATARCHALPLRHRRPLGFEGETAGLQGRPPAQRLPEGRHVRLPPSGRQSGAVSLGDQIRGFGFLHDGTVSTVFHFLNAPRFDFADANVNRRNVEQFILSLDTGLAPIVGQQVTARRSSRPRLDRPARSPAGARRRRRL